MTKITPSLASAQGAFKSAKIVKNVTSTWANIIVGTLLSIIIAPIVVNKLGNVYYGIWTLVMQFTGYLWLFDFGVRESVIKYVAQYHACDDRKALVSTVQTAITIYAVIGAAAFAVIGLMALALPYAFTIPQDAIKTARVTMVLMGATIAQGFIGNVFTGVLMGLQRFYLVRTAGILFSVARALLIVALLQAGFGIVALSVVQLFLGVGMSAVIYWFSLREVPYMVTRIVRPRRDDIKRIIGYSKYVSIINISEKIIYASDAVVIATFMPVSTLVYYAIGGSLVTHLKSFVGAMAVFVNPLISSLESKKDTVSVQRLLLTSSKAAVLAGIPVCVGFVILGQRFIDIWMGPKFGPLAGDVLKVLAISHLFGLPQHTITYVLYGLSRHRITAMWRFCEGLGNLLLSVVLIQFWGVIGVAVGTLIPQVLIVAGALTISTCRILNIPVLDYYLSVYARPLVASIPFWGACWYINTVLAPASLPAFIGEIVLTLPVYGIPVYFVAFSRGERKIILDRLITTFYKKEAQPVPNEDSG